MTEADIPALVALAQAPDIQKEFYTHSQPRDMPLDQRLKILAEENHMGGFVFSYAFEKDGQVVGYGSAHATMNPIVGTRWISYWMGEQHRGQGLCREAMQQVMSDMRIRRPQAIFRTAAAPENTASIKILERLGFMLVPDSNPYRPEFVHP